MVDAGWIARRRGGHDAAMRSALLLCLLALLLLVMPAGAGAVGELSFGECFGASPGCISEAGDPFALAGGVAASPTGGSVYATGYGSLSHFFADGNGRLSYDGCLSDDGSGGACGDVGSSANPLASGLGVAVDPNRAAVFVASLGSSLATQLFTEPGGQLRYGGCVSDGGSGGLCTDVKSSAEPLSYAAAVAVSPNGNSLYVASEGQHPAEGYLVHMFVLPEGQIKYDGCVSDDGSGGACLSLSRGGLAGVTNVAVNPVTAAVYTATYRGGIVSEFPTLSGGQLTIGGCVSEDGSGGACEDAPGKLLEGAGGLAVSPDGASLYVAGEPGTLSRLSVEPDGSIRWRECVSSDGSGGICKDVPGSGNPLAEAGSVAVSPDGQSVYVLGGSAVSAFSVGAGGALTYQACYSGNFLEGCEDLPGVPIKSGSGIAVSPNGGSVYVTSFEPGMVARLSRVRPAAGGGTPGTGGSTPGPSPGAGGHVFTAAELRASLLAQLTPSGKNAKIAAVRKRKGYRYSFRALTAGALVINWYFLPPGAHVSRKGKPKPKPVLFATGHTSFQAPGTKSITVTLSANGLKMLRHRGSIALSAKGTFSPPGAKPVVAVKAFKLKR